MQILAQDEDDGEAKDDEIPDEIRHEFHLPKQMGMYEINFHEIRKEDASKKKTMPLWSG